MVIQLIGRISGDPAYREKFRRAAEKLRARGYEVWDPTELDPAAEYEALMERCIGHLPEADALYALEGFEGSPGAMREYCVGRYVYKLDVIMEQPVKLFCCDPLKAKNCEKRGCYIRVYNASRQCCLTAHAAEALTDRLGEPVGENGKTVTERLIGWGS